MSDSPGPTLISACVSACVYDPQTLTRTMNVRNENGTMQESAHIWAWQVPKYDCLGASSTAVVDFVWPHLFEPADPPVMSDRGGICLTIAPPALFSKPFNESTHELPRLPDRWLWVRIVRRMHDSTGKWVNETPSVRAWIVDAGVSDETAINAPILIADKYGMAARQVGVSRSLGEALGHGPDEPRVALHVQGTDQSSSLTFAAFAPASMHNTSCIDTLEDLSLDELKDSAISYFVMGWYRNPVQDDPLVRLRAAGKTDEEIRAFWGWPVDNAQQGKPLGDRCVFHGLVAHIDYWNPRSYLGPAFGTPRSDALHPSMDTRQYDPQTIGFGATSEEALSALLADLVPEDGRETLSADFYRLLKALLSDRMDAWDARSGDEMMRHAELRTSFTSVPGGSVWTIGPAANVDVTPGQSKAIEMNDAQQALLAALNTLQSQYDQAQQNFASISENLYTIWWPTMRARGERKATLGEAIERYTAQAQALRADMARLQVAIASAQNELQTSLDKAFGVQVARTKAIPSTLFYQPKEPAIAIRNVGARMPFFDDRPFARSLSNVAQDPPTNTYGRLERAPIRDALRAYADPTLFATFDALCNEATLLEEAVVALVRRDGRATVFNDRSLVSTWKDRNRVVSDKLASLTFPTKDGPPIAFTKLATFWDSQPWIPIFLDWEVEWFPPAALTNATGGPLLRGRTVLANRPQNLLRLRLERMEAMSTKVAMSIATCRHLLNKAMDVDVLAQSLGGLYQQFLGRDDLLPRVLPTDEPLRSLVEQTSLAPPNLASSMEYSPLLQGSLRIRRVWVVDMFAQALRLEPAVRTARAKTAGSDLISLETRWLEPHRLAVDFVRPEGAKHPIRAWVVPNFTDNALIVYDGAGLPLGLITRRSDSDGNVGTRWRPATAQAPAGVENLVDSIVRDFLTPLVGGADALQRFDISMQQLEEALARTLPAQSMALMSPARLLGRPLALVHARMRMERRGGAWMDPTDAPWTGTQSAPPLLRKMPIWIGSQTMHDDGILGYCVGARSSTISPPAKFMANAPSFEIDVPSSAEGVALTLLTDPYGTLYFQSDMLPVQTIRLLPEWYENVVQRLPVVLEIAPALLPSHALLRSVLSPGASGASIELPLPMGTREGVQRTPATLSTSRGMDVPVKPVSSGASVPETRIAALEGILVV